MENKITVNIIPYPQKIEILPGTFNLHQESVINFDKQSQQVSQYLKKFFDQQKIKIQLSETISKNENQEESKNNVIILEIINISLQNFNSEGYQLIITQNSIKISANSQNGLFYGIQSLKQLILIKSETDSNQIKQQKQEFLPCLKITDFPRFQWRGMHLDVARHFMPKQFILKYIEYLAFFKFNMFHWHLTDDQGWRIEIKQYPNLVLIGSQRKNTEIGYTKGGIENKKYFNQPHGGFYTQEDIIEIVKYAELHFITVVPEVDGPGHLQSAIASYPELGCKQQKNKNNQVEVMCHWGISKNLINFEESTFVFFENVFKEICELFPSKFIHIGGDEVRKTYIWESQEKYQEFMQQKQFQQASQIQGYYNQRIWKVLSERGKILIGWDEILYNQDQIPNKVIMEWRAQEHAQEAAKQKIQCIISDQSCLYFDIQESRDKDYPKARQCSEKYKLPNLLNIYRFDPDYCVNQKQLKQFIIGAQGQVWTENMPTPEDVEFKIFPRILALSEIVWTFFDNKQTYLQFKQRVINFCPYFDYNKINYCKSFLKE